MKKIEFNKIQVQNFLSYGNTPTVLEFSNGINFITGYNKDDDSRNGVGKTSLIVESLSFVLFGKTYRKVNQSEIRNRLSDSTCSVTVWYTVNDVQYEVTRSVSPGLLTRTIVGQQAETKTIPETTKDILDDLGITKEVFENTLVMTARNSKSFFSQDKSLKTKFIEGILGLECFSELFKNAKDDYNLLNSQIGKLEASLNTLIQSHERDVEYAKNWDDKRNMEIHTLINDVATLRDLQPPQQDDRQIAQINADITAYTIDLDARTQSLQNVKLKLAEMKTLVSSDKTLLSKLNSHPKECPTCKRAFDDCRNDELEGEIENIKRQIAENEDKISKLLLAENKLKTSERQITQNIVNLRDSLDYFIKEQTIFDKSQQKIDAILQQIAKLQDTPNPFFEKNRESLRNLEKHREEIEENKHELKILDGVRIVFSPTGVKTAIIKMIMNIFNERFGFYLNKLKTPCKITFNEFFEETVRSLDDREISYDSLSEGEKGRVNFSLLFAFRDIRRLQSNVTINLSVFDELFDSSIDANAMMQIMDLLKDMSEEYSDCYYIITHNEGNVSSNNCNTIHLEKENGITRIVS